MATTASVVDQSLDRASLSLTSLKAEFVRDRLEALPDGLRPRVDYISDLLEVIDDEIAYLKEQYARPAERAQVRAAATRLGVKPAGTPELSAIEGGIVRS
jgi:hypothetical protein